MNVLVVSADAALAENLGSAIGDAGHQVRSTPPVSNTLDDDVAGLWPEVVVLDFDALLNRGPRVLISARQHGSRATFLLLRQGGRKDTFPLLGPNHSLVKPVDAETIRREIAGIEAERKQKTESLPLHHREARAFEAGFSG